MKNSLLATAVASTLLLASSAHAFTGKIEFTGKLVDKNPYWSIGIPAKSIQDAKGWKSKLTDGKAIKGDKTEFSFKKDIPFVEGHMTKWLEKKDKQGHFVTTGMTPVVTIAGYQLTWNENKETPSHSPKKLSVKVNSQANGTSVKDGKLDFSLTDGFVFIGYMKGDSSLQGVGKNKNQQEKAASNLMPVLASLTGKPLGDRSNLGSTKALPYNADRHWERYLGSFATKLSDFKATFDNDAIPEKWTASIPVTISYK